MKFKLVAIAFAFGLILILGQNYFLAQRCYEGTITPVFSPSDSEKLLELVKDAKHEIDLEVYEFSYKLLADALIDARERNVRIRVILEPSVYQNNAMFRYLVNNGIDVNWASENFHVTHSKFMVVDGMVVLVGSMNWSENSMRSNREASVIIRSREISNDFERIFESDFG